MKSFALGPEFLLLARCCRWNFARAPERARPEIPNNLDWGLLARLARRHRVQGLVWNALAQVDQVSDQAAESLSSDARSIAATNLGIAGESRALLEAFEEARLALRFIKGVSLGALVYRSPLLKMGWDIDLLIDPLDVERASSLLHSLGYTLRIPAETARLSTWHERSKESVWERDGFHVELHTRLADNRQLIPAIGMSSPIQRVEIAPSIALPTLAEDELLAYLSVHGASSAWFRLKWISDFAGLLAERSNDELRRIYERSQELGAARAFGQALLLADRLFGTLAANPRLRDELAGDRSLATLCRAALRLMAKGASAPTERPLGTLPIHWTQLLLEAGIAFKYSELRRQFGLLRLRQ